MAPRVEVRALLVEVQADAIRGPMWRRKSKPLGTKLKPNFGAFIDPSDHFQSVLNYLIRPRC